MIGPVSFTLTGLSGPAGDPVIVGLAGLIVGAVQLRHSYAAALGERPPGWQWTTLLLFAAVYVPFWLFGLGWASMQNFTIVTTAIFLRG